MFLRTTDPQEKAALDWFVDNFGKQDADDLISWVWSRERTTGKFVPALLHIIDQTMKNGRQFVQNLLDHARSPASFREAEEQIMQAMIPHVNVARSTIQAHKGDELAVEESMRMLRVYLRENIRRMWPDKHRATIDGAIMSATRIKGVDAFIDFHRLVEVINMPDALASTASQSHGVSEDR